MPKCLATLGARQTLEEECQTSKCLGILVEIKEDKGTSGGGVPNPPQNPPMQGMAPGMNFAGGMPNGNANGIMMLLDPVLPVGRIGLKCWETGPRDVADLIQEAASIHNSLAAPNRNTAAWMQNLCNSARPYVFLSMSSQSFSIMPIYGLQQYNVMNGSPSFVNGQYMAFIGSGDQEAVNVLRVATADTVINFG